GGVRFAAGSDRRHAGDARHGRTCGTGVRRVHGPVCPMPRVRGGVPVVGTLRASHGGCTRDPRPRDGVPTAPATDGLRRARPPPPPAPRLVGRCGAPAPAPGSGAAPPAPVAPATPAAPPRRYSRPGRPAHRYSRPGRPAPGARRLAVHRL